jgi:5-oxoprolinase (ATP-hydrolysing) subunit A
MDLLLNCDLGEAAGGDQLAIEAQVMPYIDQANIACGFHAGNSQIMDQTLVLAKQHKVAVGAHPSYPDKFNFGRQSMTMASPDLIACLDYQILNLEKNAKQHAMALSYVKPHGALYNDMMINGHLRSAVMASVANSSCSSLMLQATVHQETHRQEADMFGIQLLFEVFADRAYQDCGALVPRNQSGAILDKEKMLAQVSQLSHQGSLTTISGKRLKLSANSLCVHGDNPQAVSEISQIRAMLKA